MSILLLGIFPTVLLADNTIIFDPVAPTVSKVSYESVTLTEKVVIPADTHFNLQLHWSKDLNGTYTKMDLDSKYYATATTDTFTATINKLLPNTKYYFYFSDALSNIPGKKYFFQTTAVPVPQFTNAPHDTEANGININGSITFPQYVTNTTAFVEYTKKTDTNYTSSKKAYIWTAKNINPTTPQTIDVLIPQANLSLKTDYKYRLGVIFNGYSLAPISYYDTQNGASFNFLTPTAWASGAGTSGATGSGSSGSSSVSGNVAGYSIDMQSLVYDASAKKWSLAITVPTGTTPSSYTLQVTPDGGTKASVVGGTLSSGKLIFAIPSSAIVDGTNTLFTLVGNSSGKTYATANITPSTSSTSGAGTSGASGSSASGSSAASNAGSTAGSAISLVSGYAISGAFVPYVNETSPSAKETWSKIVTTTPAVVNPDDYNIAVSEVKKNTPGKVDFVITNAYRDNDGMVFNIQNNQFPSNEKFDLQLRDKSGKVYAKNSVTSNIPASGTWDTTTSSSNLNPPSTGPATCPAGQHIDPDTGDCVANTATDPGDPTNTGNPSSGGAGALVNGVCGPAAQQSQLSKPSTDLCTSGTASAVTGNGPWNWMCNGVNNGSSQNCTTGTPTSGASNFNGSNTNPTTNNPATTSEESAMTLASNFLQNPFKAIDSFPKLIKVVVNNIILPIAIPIIAIFIMYSGMLFVVNKKQGNVDGITRAKQTLKYTLIGAALVLGAFVIANALQSTLTSLLQ